MARGTGSSKGNKKRFPKPGSGASGEVLPLSALIKAKSNGAAPTATKTSRPSAEQHQEASSNASLHGSHKDPQQLQSLSHHHHSADGPSVDHDDYVHAHDHHHGAEGEESALCDHTNVDVAVMAQVSTLLSTLFTYSFKLAVPSLYRGMVQNVQDRVLKDRLILMIEHGHTLDEIASTAKADEMRKTIGAQFELACEEELGDIVLRLSTEDSFDLLCDLAVKHGRDLKTWGPPCACSFASCYTCLEALVDSVRSTPPTPPADVRPVNAEDLITFVEDTIYIGAASRQDWGDRKGWAGRLEDVWKGMAGTLWDMANAVDPLELPQVQSALQTLSSLNGLDLFYTVVTRELEAAQTHANGTAVPHAKPPKNGIPCRMLTPSFPTSTTGILSAQYARMIKENRALKEREQSTQKPLRALDAEERDRQTGAEYRRALARAMREQGNTAHTASRYAEATEHYTRAMGYDPSESIYPLNRAACLLKLHRYADAERDCTASLILNPDNSKAFFRRGVARAALGCREEATQDLDDALQLHHDDPSAYQELSKLRERLLTTAPPPVESVDGTAAELNVPAVKPVPLNLDVKGKKREKDVQRDHARFQNVADRLESLKQQAEPADVARGRVAKRKKNRDAMAGGGGQESASASLIRTAASAEPSSGYDRAPRLSGAGTSSLAERSTAHSSDGYASIDTEDRFSENDGTTQSVGTEATSSPSPTLSQHPLPTAQQSHEKGWCRSTENPDVDERQLFDTIRQARQNVAIQAAFAFFFSLVLQFRTGADMACALGFVPNNYSTITEEQVQSLEKVYAKNVRPSLENLGSLASLLKGQVTAMEGIKVGHFTLRPFVEASSDTSTDLKQLERLRNLGVLHAKDVASRVARFLDAPSVPVISAGLSA